MLDTVVKCLESKSSCKKGDFCINLKQYSSKCNFTNTNTTNLWLSACEAKVLLAPRQFNIFERKPFKKRIYSFWSLAGVWGVGGNWSFCLFKQFLCYSNFKGGLIQAELPARLFQILLRYVTLEAINTWRSTRIF